MKSKNKRVGLVYFERVKFVLTRPRDFFDEVLHEKGYRKSTNYFALLIAVNTIVSTVVFFIVNPLDAGVHLGYLTLSILIAVVTRVIYALVGVSLVHFWIKRFGGVAGYVKTYQVFVYSRTPGLIVERIPILGGLANIYSFYLQIIGVAKIHKISYRKVIAAYVVLILTYVVIITVLLRVAGELGILDGAALQY